ncbi:MAG: GTPase-associated system all-helical protein GASH [Elusimicrobiota bacterium]|nr:GTPase-associated system all-helical protein GASH [Elusimicrobiota bacterium]
MHNDFADWYRAVSLEPQDEVLKKRWAAVEKLFSTIDKPRGLDVARLFLGLQPKAADFAAWFADPFKTEDAGFPMKGNSAELRVLAGAVCIGGMDSSDQDLDISIAIALALVAGSYMGKRRGLVLKDVITAAREFLSQQSLRTRAKSSNDRVAGLVKAIGAVKLKCKGANTIGFMEQEFGAFADNIGDTVGALTKANTILQEETNILWWLLGGHSHDLRKPFGALDAGCVAIVAPKELADRVLILPGPRAIQAFLAQALQQSDRPRELSLAEAIEKTPKAWREARFGAAGNLDEVLDLCPSLLMMKKSLDGSKRDTWSAQAAKASAINVKDKLAPVEMSIQVFTENLLLRALGDA